MKDSIARNRLTGVRVEALKYNTSRMSTRAIELLHGCRVKLQGALDPLDIAFYRDELSEECDVVGELAALKEAQAREIELQQQCRAVRELPNKMDYANATKELDVVKNKAKALTLHIHHALRIHCTARTARR